jgi:hypothetical protein
VTAASAVSRSGVRLGEGHGYFDLEWVPLARSGCCAGRRDRIDTPECAVGVPGVGRSPGLIRWDHLEGGPIDDQLPVVELRALCHRMPQL